MNPYLILGLANNATLAQAKAAYRKLAMQHHPDRGGVEAEFKKIKAAWDMIEGGWVPTEQPHQKSSFADKPKTKPRAEKPTGPTAGKPAPGYESKGPLQVPRTRRRPQDGHNSYEVFLEIAEDKAFEGCTVQYIHAGYMQDFVVRPGSVSHTESQSFNTNPMIGGQGNFVTVKVHLNVLPKKTPYEEQTRDSTIEVSLCALGMFIGGKIVVLDHLGEKVPISIPPGYDPTKPIEVPQRGFGIEGQRGKLIVKIVPAFKTPDKLTAHELKQLQMLNEMAKAA